MAYAKKVGPNNGGRGHTRNATVRLTCEPRDDQDVVIDPSTLSLTITLPDATTAGPYVYPTHITRHTSYFKASDIVYRYLYVPTARGTYIATWTSTGTGTGVETQHFHVK